MFHRLLLETHSYLLEMSIDIRLSNEKLQHEVPDLAPERPLHLVIPGDIITKEAGYMR